MYVQEIFLKPTRVDYSFLMWTAMPLFALGHTPQNLYLLHSDSTRRKKNLGRVGVYFFSIIVI